MIDLEALAREGLKIVDRGIRPYLRRYPRIEDEFRSAANEAIARVVNLALILEDPTVYLIAAITNEFRKVQRGHLRRLNRERTASLEPLVEANRVASTEPLPELWAMFHETMELPPVPTSRAIQPYEWDIFRRIVLDNPGLNNSEIARMVNRATGRKFQAHSVWRGRQRLGI